MMTEWQGQGDGDCVRSTLKLALRDIEGEVHYVRAGKRASGTLWGPINIRYSHPTRHKRDGDPTYSVGAHYLLCDPHINHYRILLREK